MSNNDALQLVFSAALLEIGQNPTPARLSEWFHNHPEYQTQLLSAFGMQQVGWAVDGEFRRGAIYFGYYLSDKRTQEGPIFPIYGNPNGDNRSDTDGSREASGVLSESGISIPGSGVRTTDRTPSS